MKYKLRKEIVWQPAVYKTLDKYACGTLCKNSLGEIFLIGDVIEGSEDTPGCGCCAHEITDCPIVEFAIIIE